jgi:hypothetical protein
MALGLLLGLAMGAGGALLVATAFPKIVTPERRRGGLGAAAGGDREQERRAADAHTGDRPAVQPGRRGPRRIGTALERLGQATWSPSTTAYWSCRPACPASTPGNCWPPGGCRRPSRPCASWAWSSSTSRRLASRRRDGPLQRRRRHPARGQVGVTGCGRWGRRPAACAATGSARSVSSWSGPAARCCGRCRCASRMPGHRARGGGGAREHPAPPGAAQPAAVGRIPAQWANHRSPNGDVSDLGSAERNRRAAE